MTVTSTAPGRVLRCDYAGCSEPGTVEADAWSFCPRHAEHHRELEADLDTAAVATPARLEDELRKAKALLRGKPAIDPPGATHTAGEKPKRQYSEESLARMRENAARMRQRAAEKKAATPPEEGAA